MVAGANPSFRIEDKNLQMTAQEAHRFTGVIKWMTVRANISAGLKEVQEALHLCALIPLHRENHSKSGALSGG